MRSSQSSRKKVSRDPSSSRTPAEAAAAAQNSSVAGRAPPTAATARRIGDPPGALRTALPSLAVATGDNSRVCRLTRVLITGGAGFVGANLSVALAARHPDWELTAF